MGKLSVLSPSRCAVKGDGGDESKKISTQSRIPHGTNADKAIEGPSGIMPDNIQGNVEEHVHDSTYGLWIVVQRRVNGAKKQRSNVGPQPRRNVGSV